MKKNVIALAVAAAMAAPLVAQAEVTVSGTLQAELDSVSTDIGTRTSSSPLNGLMLTSGNRGKLEFKASEDLGNGMKALAHYGMNADIDGKGISQRDAYVGISGGFGTFLAGTLSSPYKSSTLSWDPFLETGAQARQATIGVSDAHNGYAKNALAYANKFGPAKVVLAYVLDETSDGVDSTNGENAVSFSVNAPVGPVELAVAYVGASKFGNIRDLGLGNTADLVGTNSLDTLTATKVGVKWTSGAIGVAGQYETVAIDDGALLDVTVNYTYINGTYTMGANTFALAYGMRDFDGDATDTYTSLGVMHGFSKNTTAYAAYVANTDNDGDDTVSAIAAGLRVNF